MVCITGKLDVDVRGPFKSAMKALDNSGKRKIGEGIDFINIAECHMMEGF